VETGTGLTLLGTAIGSKDLVVRILGPTADYLGAGAKDWTERGLNNLGRVFTGAQRMLADRIEDSGAVPPKVL
jgi:hypothetical protein